MKHAVKYMALVLIIILLIVTMYSRMPRHHAHDDHHVHHADGAISSKFSGDGFKDAQAQKEHAPAIPSRPAMQQAAVSRPKVLETPQQAAAKRLAAQKAAEANRAAAHRAAAQKHSAQKPGVKFSNHNTFKNYEPFDNYTLPELYPVQVGQNISDIGMATESFSTTIADAEHPDIVSTIAVTPDLKNQHKAYMSRNAGKFLIASQKGLVEDIDQVPQYGLRTYTCFQLQEDPSARQVSGIDLNTTNCRSRQYSNSDYMGN
jgi:hypothetical protein